MYGYYYHAGKCWEDKKLWEVTKNNELEDINIESFLKQQVYWNIGSFLELAEEMKLVLNADYSYPIILDEKCQLVDGAHRLVHAYLDGKTHIKGKIIKDEQWPEPDYDEYKQVQKGEINMNYDKGPQLTVSQLKSYLKHIPDDVKICIGIGSDNAPAHYLLNYDGQLMLHSDCYMQNATETNIKTVLSFNARKEE